MTDPDHSAPNHGSGIRVLVVRPDRLGDVVLSTPVFQVIKEHYPDAKLTVMVKKGVEPILAGLRTVDEILLYEPEGRHTGLRGFLNLVKDIRSRDFRIAVVLMSHWKIAAAAYFAGVRYRVGPRSKLHSFIFYNRGLRQQRSLVEMHETDYNLQLLRRIGIRVGSRSVPTSVHVSDSARAQAKQWLTERGWTPRQPLIIVHPGMGGSALNWPENHYLELIHSLLREGRKVLVTGGPTEGAMLDRIRGALEAGQQDQKETAIFYGGPDIGEIDFLGGLYSWASVVVAPSTGPMHMAVALGRPVVTFYPPIRVQSAIRWGPYLRDESRATVMVPEVFCGEDFKCRGSLCNYYPCMRSLLVKEAHEHVNRQLDRQESIEAEPAKAAVGEGATE